MARKLIAVAALVALMSLASAGAALAATYSLTCGDNAIIETHGTEGNIKPGAANSEFFGQYNWEEGSWKIGDTYEIVIFPYIKNAPLTNGDNLATESGTYPTITFTTTYNSIVSPGVWAFSVNIPGVLDIQSSNTTIIVTGTYTFSENAGGQWAWQGGYISGTGQNDNDDKYFSFTGTLYENYGDHTHYLRIDDFELVYPSAVPLPAGVWLLGTGLLGLACLGRRRRK
jgi:hypothetical protein